MIRTMRRTIYTLLLFLSITLTILSAPHGSWALDTIGEDEIRPGMKGYGLTVFQGVRPERFEVEVISVVPQFILRQNIILIRCDHPVTDKAGVIGGMSGSPIFIQGKLAGALAYGWRFSKEPIAGVTPIRNMLEVANRKPRGMPQPFRKRAAHLLGLRGDESPEKGGIGRGFFDYFRDSQEEQLVPARTPLTLGGFLSSARAILEDALSKFGIDPVAGGGSAGNGKGPKTFENGGSIGVQLIRGDMSATGIGTVTLVDGKSVLGFGHPMFNLGEGYFPVTTAQIHTVISSLARSNKLGSPLNEAGSLVQDRTACIVARTDKRARMIPVSVTVRDPRSKREDTYQVEVITHRLLTPRFVQAALLNIITNAASDVEDVTAEISGMMKISGREQITFFDSGASRGGLASVASFFRPVAMVGAVLDNRFETVEIEKLTFEVMLRYGLDIATVESVFVTAEEPAPGEVINVHVRLTKFDDEDQLLSIPVEIPASAAGETVQIEVAGGDYITPVMPDPANLDEALANILTLYPAKSIVVSVNVPGEGVAMRGHYLAQLPQSVVNTMQPVTGIDRIERHRTALRTVTPTNYLVAGKESFRLEVAKKRNR